MSKPFIAVEGSPAALADALAEVRDAGWEVVRGWSGGDDAVCVGVVSSEEDAAAALLAAVAGAGLVLEATAERTVLDRLYDDLLRFGPVSVRTNETPRAQRLTREERVLVELLLEGMTLGQAAARLNLSRRTADRRLASVRKKLGVETTAEVLVAVAKARSGVGRDENA